MSAFTRPAPLAILNCRQQTGSNEAVRPKSWKSLLRKVQHLGLELDDRSDVLNEHRQSFDRAVREAMGWPSKDSQSPDSAGLVIWGDDGATVESTNAPEGDAGDSLPNQDHEPDPAPTDATEVPEVMRKLWHLIASATHPDRTGNDRELAEIYKEASVAWKNREFEKLLEIAVDLGLTIEPDEVLFRIIRDRSEKLTLRVQHIENLVLWRWIQATTEEQKKELLERVVAHLKSKRP